MKVIINENQKGFLFKNNKYTRLLESGNHHIFGNNDIEVVSLDQPIHSENCSLDILLNDTELQAQASVVDVKDEQIALHYINGAFKECLTTGKYAYWNCIDLHEFTIVDTSTPMVANDIPRYIFDQMDQKFFHKGDIHQDEKGLLFYDHILMDVLDAGTYYFWKSKVNIDLEILSMKLPVESMNCPLELLVKNEKLAPYISMVEVKDEQLALHFVDGVFKECLKTGKYAFWNTLERHEFTLIDTSNPMATNDIPRYIFDLLDPSLYQKEEIAQDEKAFLFYDNVFTDLLDTGTYYFWKSKTRVDLEVQWMKRPVFSAHCPIELLIKNEKVMPFISIVEVKDEELALHYIDGVFKDCLPTGKHAFWNVLETHTFTMIDISHPLVSDDVPRYIFHTIPDTLYQKIEVSQFEKARLFYDNKLICILDAGTYYFWTTKTKVHVDIFDIRLKQLRINDEEVLTKDKVTISLDIVCRYRLTDYIQVYTEIDNYIHQLYSLIQLNLRELIGNYRIEEFIDKKENINHLFAERLKEKGASLFIEISDAGITNITLPNEIRDIMNTVLIAEKKAEASIISQKADVASTKTLMDTARMMEDSKALSHLKELEYLEKISENVESITLNGNEDILTQLSKIVSKELPEKEKE